MLVLDRKLHEGFWIDEKVFVKVLAIGRHRVKLGIDAPEDMHVIREELRGRLSQAGGGGQDAPPGYAPIILSEGSSEPYELDASATQLMRHYEMPRQDTY